jgi:predicted ATPase
VRAVIRRRLAMLSPGAQALAQTAAVIGREFTFAVLARASGQDEAAVVQSLDELWRRQLVREQGMDAYDFSHDKIRAEAYAGLSSLRRRLLHRQVAETLAEIHAPDLDLTCIQIARHFESAGQADRAIDFYRRAVASARRIFAIEEAIGYLQHLLAADFASHLAPQTRFDLLMELGQLQLLTGSWIQATASEREALALAEHLGDGALQAQAKKALTDIQRLQSLMRGWRN